MQTLPLIEKHKSNKIKIRAPNFVRQKLGPKKKEKLKRSFPLTVKESANSIYYQSCEEGEKIDCWERENLGGQEFEDAMGEFRRDLAEEPYLHTRSRWCTRISFISNAFPHAQPLRLSLQFLLRFRLFLQSTHQNRPNLHTHMRFYIIQMKDRTRNRRKIGTRSETSERTLGKAGGKIGREWKRGRVAHEWSRQSSWSYYAKVLAATYDRGLSLTGRGLCFGCRLLLWMGLNFFFLFFLFFLIRFLF